MHLWTPEMQDSTSLDSYFLAHSVLDVNFIKEASDWKISELDIQNCLALRIWNDVDGKNRKGKLTQLPIPFLGRAKMAVAGQK
jgi:hypothetical protein